VPTYEHKCFADDCGHEWEEVYGMTIDPPTVCPSCEVDGQVKRLISGGSGPGIMRRTGAEIKAGMTSNIRQMRDRAQTDENFRANLVGEDKYHQDRLQKDALTKELVNIGKKASAIKSTDVKPGKVRRLSKGKGEK